MASSSLTIKQKILYVWQHGGPQDPSKPDELKSWIEAFFPGDYKSETVFRRARELRSGSVLCSSRYTSITTSDKITRETSGAP